MVVKKPDGQKFDIKGKLYDQLRLKMVVDGYNAPITGTRTQPVRGRSPCFLSLRPLTLDLARECTKSDPW